MYKTRKHIVWLAFILSAFLVIYSSISLVNHYLFRTYALDLGMFSQAIRNASLFQKPTFTLSPTGQELPFLATHFSPIIFLFAPLYYFCGSYTLLIVQIIAILFGGVGAYFYSKHRMGNEKVIPIIALIHFFSIWGIYSALTYDFHCNVLGAMLVPWFFLFYERKQYKPAFITVVMAVLTIETMPLWFAFIITSLAITNFNRKKTFSG